jgi:hypothetical protein
MERSMLRLALTTVMLLLAGLPTSGATSMQLVGGGLIGAPIQGKTINSPSDFGLAATADGGTFVCSMAGPLTGNFMGMTVMTVEGPVTKGTLKITGRTATFAGNATVVLVPGMKKEPVEVLNNVPYSVIVGLGGPGKGWLMMKVPQFTKVLGGDTGGMIKVGSIALEK